MRDWLSSTWEANWRSFQYFNLYRLILGGLFLLALVFPGGWISHLKLLPSLPIFGLVVAYLAATGGGYLLARRWRHQFDVQLSVQVAVDVLIISTLMYIAGGVGSGLGLILLVSLAAASLVGRGRLVLFYAALSTLAALLSQILGVVQGEFELTSIVQAGFVSAGYFATAILARLLGQRVMANEDLARRRGEALDNQIRISQRIVERMQDGVLIVSADGRIVRWNPMAASLLQLPAEGGSLQLYAPTVAAALSHWLAGRSADTVMLNGPANAELSVRFEPTASSDRELLVFVEDMGRIKERARQLKLAALGRLTASIAHEIRNPLAAISHAAELLPEEGGSEVRERLLRIINDNTGRLNRIVGDVLELGRQNSARPEAIILDDFCEAFVSSVAAAESLADGVVRCHAEPGLALFFDRAQLHQVLGNLVGNALRHASGRDDSVRIEIRAASRPGWVELHVIDDGPGVPEAARDQIFEPFFTTHHRGTGLGLYIARELCGANGATLELAATASGGHFILTGRSNTCLLTEANGGNAAS